MDLGRTPQVVGARHDARDRGRVAQLHFLALDGHFRRHLEVDGPRASQAHLPERLGHRGRDIPGPHGLPPPLGHRGDHLSLVQHFMNRAQVLAHLPARDLAGNEKDRRGSERRQWQGRRRHCRHPRPGRPMPRRASPKPGVAVGPMRGAILMPCGDMPDARLVPALRRRCRTCEFRGSRIRPRPPRAPATV